MRRSSLTAAPVARAPVPSVTFGYVLRFYFGPQPLLQFLVFRKRKNSTAVVSFCGHGEGFSARFVAMTGILAPASGKVHLRGGEMH